MLDDECKNALIYKENIDAEQLLCRRHRKHNVFERIIGLDAGC